MSAHTPKPWEAEHEKCNPPPSPNDPGFFTINAPILGRHGPVADTMNRDHCISPEEDRANGYLIAAAPDLLEALCALGVIGGGYCFCSTGRDPDGPGHEHECRHARAAIKKATQRRSLLLLRLRSSAQDSRIDQQQEAPNAT